MTKGAVTRGQRRQSRNVGVVKSTEIPAVHISNANASLFRQVGNAVSGIQNIIDKNADRMASEIGRLEGQAAGAMGNPEMRDIGTIRGRAYNEAATRTFTNRQEAGSRLAMQEIFHNNFENPEEFKRLAQARIEGMADQFNSIAPGMSDIFKQKMAIVAQPYFDRARENKFKKTRAEFAASSSELIRSSELEIDNVAGNLFSDDPKISDSAVKSLAATLGSVRDSLNHIDPETNREMYNASQKAQILQALNDRVAGKAIEQWIQSRPDKVAAYRKNILGQNTAGLTSSGTIRRIIDNESNGVADAKNPKSTALGVGQFIESTWLDMVERYEPSLKKGRSRDQILALRKDPLISEKMVEHYANENSKILRAAGFQASPANIYMAHFLGPNGAVKVLQSDDRMKLSKILESGTIKSNPHLSGKTAGWLKVHMFKKMGSVRPDLPLPEDVPDLKMNIVRVSPDGKLESGELNVFELMSTNARASALKSIRASVGDAISQEIKIEQAAQKQKEAENNALSANLGISVSRGQATYKDLESAKDNGIISDARFESLTEQLDKAALKTSQNENSQALVAAALNGTAFLDPRSKDHRQAANTYYRQHIAPVIQSGEKDVQTVLTDFVKRTGIVPSDAVSYVSGMLASGSPEQKLSAASMVDMIGQEVPNALQAFNSKDVNYSKFLAKHAQFQDLEMAVERANNQVYDANDSVKKERERRFNERKRNTSTRMNFAEKFKSEFNVHEHGIFTRGVEQRNLPMAEGMVSEFLELAEQAFIDTGDGDLAYEAAKKQIFTIWGETYTRGKGRGFMRRPPEKHFQHFGSAELDAEWLREQMLSDLEPMFKNSFVDPNKTPLQDRVFLVSDHITDRQSQPSWSVWYVDAEGRERQLVGRKGPVRWTGVPFKDSLAGKREAKKVQNEIDRLRQYKVEGPQGVAKTFLLDEAPTP